MTCIFSWILSFLLRSIFAVTCACVSVCVFVRTRERALVPRRSIDIDDCGAAAAVAHQYLKHIIVPLKPAEDQMRRGNAAAPWPSGKDGAARQARGAAHPYVREEGTRGRGGLPVERHCLFFLIRRKLKRLEE